MERDKRRAERSSVDLKYLKNCVLQLYQMGDGLALLPVIARLLELSPEEVDACRAALRKAGVGMEVSG